MRVLHRQRPVEAPSKHRTPSWPGRPSADDSISFADIKRLPDPDWIGRSQQAGFTLDAELLEPLELTDWSAQLADAWKHHTAKVDNYAEANQRASERTCDAYASCLMMLAAPLLSELTELKAVTLVNWRQALRVHGEAELALCGAKAEVA